jgi:hypothetical protein
MFRFIEQSEANTHHFRSLSGFSELDMFRRRCSIPCSNDENVTSTPPPTPIEYASPGAGRPRRWLGLLSLILAALQFPCYVFAVAGAYVMMSRHTPISPGAGAVYLFFAFSPAWLAIGLGARAFYRNLSKADVVLGFTGMIGGLAWLILIVFIMVRTTIG